MPMLSVGLGEKEGPESLRSSVSEQFDVVVRDLGLQQTLRDEIIVVADLVAPVFLGVIERLVGQAQHLDGRAFVSADEAYAMGLVSLVCADDQVIPEALKMAKLIANMPPLAVEQIKEVVIAGMDASLDTALMLERKANQILFATQDQKEGMNAFIEKRQAMFKGQ